MKLKLTIELDVDDGLYGFSDEEREWLFNGIIMDDCGEGLALYSNEIGDELGVVNVLDVKEIKE
jgi:hypothetical protein|tara:strand:+ start:43 stop:234 length:192 start_codon:yes stop_codon:yes gene_type:complete